MEKTVVVEREYDVFVPKYDRYMKRRSRVPAHISPCLDVEEGDQVRIAETRPLSKTKSHVVVSVLGDGREDRQDVDHLNRSQSHEEQNEKDGQDDLSETSRSRETDSPGGDFSEPVDIEDAEELAATLDNSVDPEAVVEVSAFAVDDGTLHVLRLQLHTAGGMTVDVELYSDGRLSVFWRTDTSLATFVDTALTEGRKLDDLVAMDSRTSQPIRVDNNEYSATELVDAGIEWLYVSFASDRTVVSWERLSEGEAEVTVLGASNAVSVAGIVEHYRAVAGSPSTPESDAAAAWVTALANADLEKLFSADSLTVVGL